MDRCDQEVQVNLAVVRKQSTAVQEARRRRQEEVARRNDPFAFLFAAADAENGEVQFPPEGITISSLEQLSQLKSSIFANADCFQLTAADIQTAEDGTFELDSAPPDFIRLFSSRLVSDILDRAIASRATAERGTQTRDIVRAAHAQAGTVTRSHVHPFLGLIRSDYSEREPQSLIWMIRTIRIIYDEKWQLDRKAISERRPLEPFAYFTFKLAGRMYELAFMADQFCWDLYNTGMDLRQKELEVEIFMDALAGNITVEQLSFMLKCRDDVLKIGALVSRKTDEPTEQIPDYYLSQDQLKSALKSWWQHRFSPAFVAHAMQSAVPRPAPHLEATKRYVAMNHILAGVITDFSKDTTARMIELLQKSRLNPRLMPKEFAAFMKSLIPYATDDDCDAFYRATVSKSVERTDISHVTFKYIFTVGSVLYRDRPIQSDDGLTELLVVIERQWADRKSFVTTVLNRFRGMLIADPDNLGIQSLVTDVDRFQTMLIHSISIQDAIEACSNYHELMFSIDLLFAAADNVKSITEDSLISLESSIYDYWLESVFGN
jgi:hypothetical protein